MHQGLMILAIALDAAAAALLAFWIAGLNRMIETFLKVPSPRRGIELAAADPPASSVCIIIPAHNEQAVIADLVRSLRAQRHANFRVVLCLDRCTDATEERARAAIDRDERFSIVRVDSCPEDWAGKVNATWQGAQTPAARQADFLLFVDADTTLDPDCISAILALARERRLDLVSLLSTLSSRRWFELLVQPAAGIELIRQYPIVRANRGHHRRAFANGQFMLVARPAYEAVGGHPAVHTELLEDLALARLIADAGRPAGLFPADGLLACRMYESWPAFRRGWKRIYTESTHRKPARLRKAIACTTLAGSIFPVLTAANLAFSAWLLARPSPAHVWGIVGLSLSGAAVAITLIVLIMSYRLSRAPLWTIPGYFAGAWLVGLILLEALRDLARGIPTSWAGREYIRTPR